MEKDKESKEEYVPMAPKDKKHTSQPQQIAEAKPESKIFLIGRRRTGMGSFLKALTKLGFNEKTILTQDKFDAITKDAKEEKKHDIGLLIKVMEPFDICGLDWVYDIALIKEIEKAFPSSRFILTEREVNVWYASWIGYYSKKPKNSIRNWYGMDDEVDEDREAKINHLNRNYYMSQFYSQYNDAVRLHFQGREWKLLQFFYGKNANWQTICQYFKKALPPNNQFPFENRNVKEE